MEQPAPFAESGSGPLEQKKIATLHHPEGISPDQMFFDEQKVHDLILAYQRDGNPETWKTIVLATLPLIDSLIRKHGFQLYEDQQALRNEAVIKLSKSIKHYDPQRGRAFTVLTIAITRFLISHVATIRTRTKRICQVPDEVLAQTRPRRPAAGPSCPKN
jgi:hypothetical protein